MQNNYQYQKFEDWFGELELFGFRSERFFDAIDAIDSHATHIEWLKAAFEAARLIKGPE